MGLLTAVVRMSLNLLPAPRNLSSVWVAISSLDMNKDLYIVLVYLFMECSVDIPWRLALF